MPSSSSHASALHGNVIEKSRIAILLIDVINTFDFPGAGSLVEASIPMATEIAILCREARRRKIPVINANDNFGRWRSNLTDIVSTCKKGRGSKVVRLLLPQKCDYFVLKPKNSAFYATTLDLLLHHIGVRKLALAGVLTDNCVLFSANEAYVRDYHVIIPSDCVASVKAEHKITALKQMKRVLKADIRPWRQSMRWMRNAS